MMMDFEQLVTEENEAMKEMWNEYVFESDANGLDTLDFESYVARYALIAEIAEKVQGK